MGEGGAALSTFGKFRRRKRLLCKSVPVRRETNSHKFLIKYAVFKRNISSHQRDAIQKMGSNVNAL